MFDQFDEVPTLIAPEDDDTQEELALLVAAAATHRPATDLPVILEEVYHA